MNKYINEIIAAVNTSNPASTALALTGETRFHEIPNMDSMSIVNFQTELASVVGEKANEVLPLPEMTISDYAKLLEGV